jgi:hypothetical protein
MRPLRAARRAKVSSERPSTGRRAVPRADYIGTLPGNREAAILEVRCEKPDKSKGILVDRRQISNVGSAGLVLVLAKADTAN